jgi:hypothetical protein
VQSKTVPKNKKQSHDFTSLSNDILEEFRSVHLYYAKLS